jgi:hypothetical protein
MASDYKAPRRHQREELPLPVRVECRESEDHEWEELTHLLDVAPFGARLRITHPTEPGRLLHLTLPMPRRLRCYDHEQEQYRVWSVVRHCRPLPSTDDELPHFEIGVAFIGKDCPATHETDPAKRYEIAAGLTKTDLWRTAEASSPDDSASSNRRSETRHDVAHDVVIEIYDPDGRVSKRETTKTENISRHGMAVFTNLNIVRGRYIRVRSAQYRIAVIAAVRRLAPVGDGRKRLHLEFVDQQWPPL